MADYKSNYISQGHKVFLPFLAKGIPTLFPPFAKGGRGDFCLLLVSLVKKKYDAKKQSEIQRNKHTHDI